MSIEWDTDFNRAVESDALLVRIRNNNIMYVKNDEGGLRRYTNDGIEWAIPKIMVTIIDYDSMAFARLYPEFDIVATSAYADSWYTGIHFDNHVDMTYAMMKYPNVFEGCKVRDHSV